jgi:hypothetical protein
MGYLDSGVSLTGSGSTTSTRKQGGSRQGVNEDGKASKGLRHFSMKVCKKVEEKGQTTYNEVADELVREFVIGRETNQGEHEVGKKGKGMYDEKNIRRRVYDALNVLMAMDIISKEKKEIRWKGLPSNAQHDLDLLSKERDGKAADVERKREQLKELIRQGRGYKALREHNEEREMKEGEEGKERIPLPFIVVSTDEATQVQCEMGR